MKGVEVVRGEVLAAIGQTYADVAQIAVVVCGGIDYAASGKDTQVVGEFSGCTHLHPVVELSATHVGVERIVSDAQVAPKDGEH